jgi:hypothetical protein
MTVLAGTGLTRSFIRPCATRRCATGRREHLRRNCRSYADPTFTMLYVPCRGVVIANILAESIGPVG